MEKESQEYQIKFNVFNFLTYEKYGYIWAYNYSEAKDRANRRFGNWVDVRKESKRERMVHYA